MFFAIAKTKSSTSCNSSLVKYHIFYLSILNPASKWGHKILFHFSCKSCITSINNLGVCRYKHYYLERLTLKNSVFHVHVRILSFKRLLIDRSWIILRFICHPLVHVRLTSGTCNVTSYSSDSSIKCQCGACENVKIIKALLDYIMRDQGQ